MAIKALFQKKHGARIDSVYPILGRWWYGADGILSFNAVRVSENDALFDCKGRIWQKSKCPISHDASFN